MPVGYRERMLVVSRCVDVLNPKVVKGIIGFRSYDDAGESWGNAWTSLERPFDSIEDARSWVNLFTIGQEEPPFTTMSDIASFAEGIAIPKGD